MKRWMKVAPPLSSVAREPAGGGAPGLYLPVSTPCAIGEKTIWPMPSSSAGRHDLALDHPPQHRVLRLVGHEREADLLRERLAVADLLARSTRSPRCRAPCRRGRGRRTPASSPRAASRRRSGAPGRGRRSRSAAGAGELSIDSMMCLRDRPESFGPFGPVGQNTFVRISSDARRSPLSASPSTVSAVPFA